jgi:hypothetical protein
MLVHQAKNVARRWALEEATNLPGFQGVYFAGSINTMAEDAVLSPTSDLDLNVVFTDSHRVPKSGKFIYHGVLLEVTCLPLSQIRTPEEVLSDYHLAGGFRTRSVVLDPSGHLSALQSSVSRDFARGNWVRRRRDHAKNRILKQLAAIDTSDPLHDQVTGWVFPTRGHHPCAAHGGPAEPYGSAAVRCGP